MSITKGEKMVKVSILVPVYNVEKYLIQCMESLVNQTLKEIEIICIDDGSTDKSSSILDEYAKNYSSVKVIHKNNTGYGHSMNVGMKMASGEYIGIVESDDFIDVNMFENLYRVAKQNDVSIVRSSFYRNANGIDKYERIGIKDFNVVFDPVADNIDFVCSFPIWSCVYKNEFLHENGIWFNETPGASYQDLGFCFKTFSCTKGIIFLKDAFYHYRVDNEESSMHSLAKVFCVCDEFEEIWRFLSQRNVLNETYKYRIPEYQYAHYISNYDRMSNKYKESFIKRMIEDFSELEKKDLLRREYWVDEYAWLQARMMIENPEKMMYQNKIRIQNRCMYNAAFHMMLHESEKIFIYGAGKVGHDVARYLLKKNIKPAGFFVSDTSGQPQSVMGIDICSIETACDEDRNALVLVSVKEADIYPIMNILEQLGFINVIAMTLELRKSIFNR